MGDDLSPSVGSGSRLTAGRRHLVWDAGFVGLLVFAAALFGLWTRPAGLLAALWPANALLLGVMVRYPRLNTPWGWLMAVAGYYAADLLTGGEFFKTTILTIANLVGVATGVLLFARIDRKHVGLREPVSVLYLILVVTASASAAGMVGAVANPLLFHGDPIEGWVFWFVSELVNFMAVLPMVLALPDFPWRLIDRRRTRFPRPTVAQAMPVLALVASCLLGEGFGGPGALAFPVPALLWCAVTFSMSVTAALTLLVSTGTLLAISFGYIAVAVPVPTSNTTHTMLSLRMGMALITLAPITVASVMAARNELFQRMQYMAEHDQLTGLLNRRAFIDRCSALLSKLAAAKRPAAVLMLDIDHFKKINDTYGHAAGDLLLKAFARTAGDHLRETEPIGRIGGEEFAILLPDCTPEVALAVGERVRAAFAECVVGLDDGRRAATTVSIGIVFMRSALPAIEHPLSLADQALYRAKQGGRNRIELAGALPGDRLV